MIFAAINQRENTRARNEFEQLGSCFVVRIFSKKYLKSYKCDQINMIYPVRIKRKSKQLFFLEKAVSHN